MDFGKLDKLDFSSLLNYKSEMENRTQCDELYSNVPDFCFIPRNTELHKIIYAAKPIYVFENHAASLKAWWEISQGLQLNVLTFDEHTDTHPPLWAYCIHVLNHDEKALIDSLDKLKANLSRSTIDSFYERTDEYLNSFHQRLKHDEHIATAIYLNIIQKAYVCSSSSSNPKMLISNENLQQLYKNIVPLESPFVRMSYPSEFSKCSFFCDFAELQRKVSVNLDNDTIDNIMVQLPLDIDFILDIDLDYFQSPFILDKKYYSLSSFCKLIKRAKGITIAAETNCVLEQVEKYDSIISKIDKNCKLIGCVNPFRKRWDSRQLLKYVLGLIEYVLSGQWEQECEINKRVGAEWNKMHTARDENALPLIPRSS